MRVPGPLVPVVVAAWSAVIGLVCAFALAAIAGLSGDIATSGSVVWLAAHHAAISTEVGNVTLLPIGLMLITVLPVRRGGRYLRAVHSDGVPTITAVASIGCYSVVAVAVAFRLNGSVTVPLWSAALSTALVSLLAGGWGVRRGAAAEAPARVDASRAAVRAIGLSVGVPVILGAVLTAALIVSHWGAIQSAEDALTGPDASELGVVLLQLAYLPNLVVWAGAFVLGSGITLSTDLVLSPFAAGPATLPGLPLLESVPDATPSWSALLPVLAATAGGVAAWALDRSSPVQRLRGRVRTAAIVVFGTGLVWFVLATLAGGSLGDGRLAHLGPAPGTALTAGLLAGCGAVLWALLPFLTEGASARRHRTAAPERVLEEVH